MAGKHVLPDILGADLDVVFVGVAAGEDSAKAGTYYKNPRNRFWKWLHLAGFTPNLLRSEDDHLLPAFGIGLSDLSKTVHQSHNRGQKLKDSYDCQGLLDRLAPHSPKVVAFNGQDMVMDAFAEYVGHPYLGFGPQPWTVGDSLAFVLPASSNNWPERVLNDASGVGRTVIDYWREVAAFIDRT